MAVRAYIPVPFSKGINRTEYCTYGRAMYRCVLRPRSHDNEARGVSTALASRRATRTAPSLFESITIPLFICRSSHRQPYNSNSAKYSWKLRELNGEND